MDRTTEAKTEREWKDPEYFAVTPLPSPALPDGLRGTLLGDLATEFSDQWGVPPLLTVLTGLGVLSAATRGELSVLHPNGSKEFPLALYILALADSGTLKSPMMEALTAALIREQARTVTDHRAVIGAAVAEQEAAEAAIKILRSTLVKLKTKPKDKLEPAQQAELDSIPDTIAARTAEQLDAIPDGKSIVVCGADFTYESAVKHAAANGGRIAFLSTEGTLIENLAGRYSKDGRGKSEFFNQAYDREPHALSRNGDQDGEMRMIEQAWASLTMLVQPDVVNTMLSATNMKKRGFMQRFLVASVPPGPYLPRYDLPPISAALLDRWATAVRGIWARADSPGAALTSAGTTAAIREFEHRIVVERIKHWRETEHELIVGFLSKIAMTTLRKSGLLTLSDDPGATAVSERHARAAVSLAEALIEQVEYLYARSERATENLPEMRVLRWLAERDATTVTTRDTARRFADQGWFKTTDDARAALEQLCKLGWVLGPKSDGTGVGRPSERWDVHPDIRYHYDDMLDSLHTVAPHTDDTDDTDNMTEPEDIVGIVGVVGASPTPGDGTGSGDGAMPDDTDNMAEPEDIVGIVGVVGASPTPSNGHRHCAEPDCTEPVGPGKVRCADHIAAMRR